MMVACSAEHQVGQALKGGKAFAACFRVPGTVAEDSIHSDCSGGMKFSICIADEGHLIGFCIHDLADFLVAFWIFFGACCCVKPMTEEGLQVACFAVLIEQVLGFD